MKTAQDMMGLLSKSKGKMGGEREKRTAYLGWGRSGFQDLVAAQTQLATLLRLNFARELGL